MPSQEGGVNIPGVVWYIMLFGMLLPYAYDLAILYVIAPSPCRHFGSRRESWHVALCLLKVLLCALLLLVVTGSDIQLAIYSP